MYFLVLEWLLRQKEKRGIPDSYLKCIPHGRPTISWGFLCSRRVNGFWWSLLLCLNHHVVLGNKIWCSHRVHSHMALPALSNILKLWACCPCCTFCQTAPKKKRKKERGKKNLSIFFTYYLSLSNLLLVSVLCLFFLFPLYNCGCLFASPVVFSWLCLWNLCAWKFWSKCASHTWNSRILQDSTGCCLSLCPFITGNMWVLGLTHSHTHAAGQQCECV